MSCANPYHCLQRRLRLPLLRDRRHSWAVSAEVAAREVPAVAADIGAIGSVEWTRGGFIACYFQAIWCKLLRWHHHGDYFRAVRASLLCTMTPMRMLIPARALAPSLARNSNSSPMAFALSASLWLATYATANPLLLLTYNTIRWRQLLLLPPLLQTDSETVCKDGHQPR